MTWRLAKSLEVLRNQINEAYPNRSKASDGTIGDPNHQAEGSGSDHNPNRAGVVCAFDITHDPANGVDIDKLSDALADSRDPRIKYLIANSLILVPADYGWKWVTYTGSNPHTSHLHVSVYGDYDDQSNWNIGKRGEEPMIIQDNQVDYDRFRKLMQRVRNRDLPRVEFKDRFVGNEFRRMVEVVLDDKEADEAYKLQLLGNEAAAGDWKNKLTELQNKLSERALASISKDQVIQYLTRNLK